MLTEGGQQRFSILSGTRFPTSLKLRRAGRRVGIATGFKPMQSSSLLQAQPNHALEARATTHALEAHATSACHWRGN